MWVVDYRLDGVRHRKHFKFKDTAKKFLKRIDETIDQRKAGLKCIEPILFGDFCQLYLDNHFKTKSRSYKRSSTICINKFIAYFGADVLLTDINSEQIVLYRNHRIESGLSNKSVINELGLLHSIFKKAIDNSFALVNPCEGVEKPQNIARYKRSHWTDEEFNLAMRNSGAELQKGLLIMINTGLRRQELFNLQKSDIDLVQGILCVRSLEGRTTKNYRPRTVPLPNVLIKFIRTLPDGPIMSITPKAFERRFDRVRKRIGLQRVLHELRHTYISRMLKAGTDKKTVQEWIGQETAGVIDRYTHMIPETNETWKKMVNKGVNIGEQFVQNPANVIEFGHQVDTKKSDTKKAADNLNNINGFKNLNGGGGGIRTHGTLPHGGFQDRCLQPLGHPSVLYKYLMIHIACKVYFDVFGTLRF